MTVTSLCRASHFLTYSTWLMKFVCVLPHCISDPCKRRWLCVQPDPMSLVHTCCPMLTHMSRPHTTAAAAGDDVLRAGQVEEVSCCNGRLGVSSCHSVLPPPLYSLTHTLQDTVLWDMQCKPVTPNKPSQLCAFMFKYFIDLLCGFVRGLVFTCVCCCL